MYLLFSWRSWNWLGQVLYTLCLPGAAAALVFPDWTVYPQWSLMNINSFLVHGLLILFPVLQLAAGTIRPRLSAIWKPLLFLAVVTPPIWLFNRTWGTNYFFLNTASPNSPLALLLEVTGPAWYLARLRPAGGGGDGGAAASLALAAGVKRRVERQSVTGRLPLFLWGKGERDVRSRKWQYSPFRFP